MELHPRLQDIWFLLSALVANLATEYSLPLKVNYSGSWGYHIQLSQSKRRIRESDLPPVFVQVSNHQFMTGKKDMGTVAGRLYA
jgi:hypothetical protein